MRTRSIVCFGALTMYSVCLFMNIAAFMQTESASRALFHVVGAMTSVVMIALSAAYAVWGEER